MTYADGNTFASGAFASLEDRDLIFRFVSEPDLVGEETEPVILAGEVDQ